MTIQPIVGKIHYVAELDQWTVKASAYQVGPGGRKRVALRDTYPTYDKARDALQAFWGVS